MILSLARYHDVAVDLTPTIVVEASRSILFDLHSRLGLDFGILIAWGAVNTLFFPFCCYFMRWKQQKGVHEYWPLD